jgi:hypothetical protein
LVIPSESGNFVELRASRTRRVGSRRIFEIPNVYLPIGTTGRQKMCLERVEVEATNGTRMLIVLEYEGLRWSEALEWFKMRGHVYAVRKTTTDHPPSRCNDLSRIPQVQFATLHPGSNDAFRPMSVTKSPDKSVESENWG